MIRVHSQEGYAAPSQILHTNCIDEAGSKRFACAYPAAPNAQQRDCL
jgi:hypothetical protein